MRLVIALSVAAALAVFLLYTSFAGGATPSLKPSQLAGHKGKLSVSGYVLAPDGTPAKVAEVVGAIRDARGLALVGHEPALSELLARLLGSHRAERLAF